MSAREEILRKVSLGNKNREAGYAAIPRHYNTALDLPLIEVFTERLIDYNANVHRCAAADIARTIDAILTERGKSGLLVPTGIDPAWLPAGRDFRRDSGFSYADLDQSEGVLTGCAVAIALTGTIILQHLPENGRRALTLIPDYHLCVVFEDQVQATVPQAFRQMAQNPPHLWTTISGPSATADIEMIRVKGVHGPRTLEVILATR